MATMTAAALQLQQQQLNARTVVSDGGGGGSTQILVKNTFIQFEALLDDATGSSRPRGESCDAVIFTHLNSTSKKPTTDLICIPEMAPSGAIVEGPEDGGGGGSDSLEEPLAPYTHRSDEGLHQHTVQAATGCETVHLPCLYERGIDKDHIYPHLTEGSRRQGFGLDQPGSSTTADSNEGITPNELIESLAAYEPLKKMPLDELPMPTHEKTTIMLRNIPNKYTQAMLLDAVNQEFEGLYDFFYLPIDFKNKCNVGYAFINFIHPYYAEMFSKKFAGMKLTAFKSKKICEVSWGRVQGFRANIEHYRNSAIMSIPNAQYKPLVFKDGIPLQFPGPAGPIPTVKPRHGRNGGGNNSGNNPPANAASNNQQQQ